MNWNGTITVLDDNEEGGLHSLLLEDVLYFEYIKRGMLAHTREHTYQIPWGQLTVVERLLSVSSDYFERVDVSCFLNLKKVKILNPERSIAYFDEQGEGSNKYCYIAYKHYKAIANKLTLLGVIEK